MSGQNYFPLVLSDFNGHQKSFDSIEYLADTLTTERNFWKDLNIKYNGIHSVIRVIPKYDELCNSITRASGKTVDEAELKVKDNALKYTINLFKATLESIPFSDSPFTAHLVGICKIDPAQANSFINYFLPSNSAIKPSLETKADIEGTIRAYEYKTSGENQLTKRAGHERKTLKQLATDFNRLIHEAQVEKESSKKLFDDWLIENKANSDKATENRKKEFEQIKNYYSGEYEKRLELLDNKSAGIEQAIAISNENIEKRANDLESLYVEKLRLDKPVAYWSMVTKRLGREALAWLCLLVLSIAFGACILQILYNKFINSNMAIASFSVQHIIMLLQTTGIIAVCAYLIKISSKLTFSAYHLKRDAEERIELVYSYLTLAKNTTIDEDSRKIILQSLFSRANSGLLAGDHGPTLPSTELLKTIEKVTKSS